MADYFPLIVVAANSSIDELPAGDNLNLSGSNIVNAINITATTNITANTFLGNFSGNFAISGGNTEVVFISNGNTNTSTKFTFNTTGNILTVDGNAQFSNTNLGNLATANFFTGNGSLLTALTGANVSGQVANALVAGTVYTNAQPNITSVGTLTSLGVSGTITAANITANSGVFTGNGNGLSSLVGANVSGAVAYATTANAVAGANVSGAVSYATTANSVAGANVTGDVSGANHANVADSANAVSGANVSGAVAYATTANAVAGANVSGQVANALVAGTIYTNAQPNITSVGTLTSLDVSGTITAANITANTGVFTGNGNGLSSLVGANVTGTVANATYALSAGTAGTVTTNAQPNITSVGTLTSLTVTGNVTGANLVVGLNGKVYTSEIIDGGTGIYLAAGPSGYINFFTTGGDKATITDTGNIAASNLIANSTVFAGTANVIGNVNAGNVYANSGTIGASLLTGTLTTSAQPNITSVGTLTSLAVTGNITNGNITGGNLVSASFVAGTLTTAAQPNITSTGTLTSLSVTGNVTGGNLVTAGVLSVTGNGVSSIGGNLDMTSNNIINLAAPVNSTDAATKQYVDDVAQGLNIHDSCNAATTGTLATISGGTVTYDNGTSGVGATLTTTGSYTTIDGVTLSDGMRILVKNEVSAANNGIYVRTSSTVLTRATDFNSVPEIEAGDFTFVTAGTQYDNTGWVQTSTVVTVGTDPIDWTQFSGAGTYTAGTGLTLTGSVFSVNVAQPTITSVGTLTSLGVSGNITAANITANTGIFSGNGSGLTALDASNISSGTLAQARLANASVTLGSTALTLGSTVTTVAGLSSVTSTTFVGALTGAATTAGTVTTAAQGNITSVGTLTSLSVSGNITGGNANIVTDLTVGNSVVIGNGSAYGNVTTTQFAGIFAKAGGLNATSLVQVKGNDNTAGMGMRVISASTSLIYSNAAIEFKVGSTIRDLDTPSGGTTIATIASTGLTVTGIVSATGNVTGGNLITGGIVSATGNGTFGNVSVNAGTVTLGTLTTGANTTAGTITGNFSLSAGSRLNATYADLAEKYVADATYESGTVLVFGGEHEVTVSTESDSFRVAGVVTTNPAYTMNNECEGEHVATIALQGRVPVKVIGPIFKGDLLVSCGNGHAIANNIARAGTIIGKSLENFNEATGVIEVAVGRF